MPLASRPVVARVFPFAVFIAFIALQPVLAAAIDERWVVALRGVVVAALLAWFWRDYAELGDRPAPTQLALGVGVGIGVFLLWITFDSGWALLGEPGRGFVPTREDGTLDVTLVALRLFGLALVVPVMEELFWRSFLMRWIAQRDFRAIEPRAVGAVAFALSSGLFALEHSQWFAGLLAGAAYAWLYMRSGNLWTAIASHTTTNAILGTWVLATGRWSYW
ncbi:MAG TPA: CAAX prenyl protease-related protein [Usitatibacter sp.]|nr:CAAX prenyl protease-related protein [Usitatibacter sp.]